MHKFANDAADERKREAEERKILLELANYRENQAFEKVTTQEQQTLEFMQDMLRRQNDFALKQNDFAVKQNELALQRENQIRADMKELAASEAKVAALQQKLEKRDLIMFVAILLLPVTDRIFRITLLLILRQCL